MVLRDTERSGRAVALQGTVRERGFKIKKVKWGKGEKPGEDRVETGGRMELQKRWRQCVKKKKIMCLCEIVFFLRAYKLYWR